jgi:hypothetical protein
MPNTSAQCATPLLCKDLSYLSSLVVEVDGLSLLLRRETSTIQADRNRRPESLPPACIPPGSRTPLWIVDDVIQWLRQHQESCEPEQGIQTIAKIGAPTKAERIAAEAKCMTVKQWRFAQGKGAE